MPAETGLKFRRAVCQRKLDIRLFRRAFVGYRPGNALPKPRDAALHQSSGALCLAGHFTVAVDPRRRNARLGTEIRR